ncbi:MAG TPA: MFS transporter [Tepidisphaeraceae bacterium]|nr:MFS transporter [Tepidisphaeraceae bacterium]
MADLLSTRRGRLSTFFLLYVTEGIPVGFSAVAVAAQLRRQGVSPAAVGTFVAAIYLPWAWKWAVGPVVDLVYVDRVGARRGWILLAQLMMALTLLAAMPIDFVGKLGLFAWVIVLHNAFAATQDVAIDALAVETLPADERGAANGLMFAGAYVGNAVGGSGALFLSEWIGFRPTFVFVAAAILVVTLTVTLRLRERPRRRPAPPDGTAPAPLPPVAARVSAYGRTVGTAMFGSPGAIAVLVFALLPTGAYALSLTLQSNLAVELGLSDSAIALLALFSAVLAAAGCVAGGWLSDRYGRRKMLAAFVVATALPTLWVAAVLYRSGWVMPVNPTAPGRPTPSAQLLAVFWAATLVYSLLNGLMYGSRAAFFMDLTETRIGATQFTAYMAVLNLVIAYSSFWQGRSADRLGYPATLALDALLGCAGLAVLPWCRRAASPPGGPETASPGVPG